MPNPLLPFYPVISPNSKQFIPVGSGHEIYVATYGNKAGIPVIMLHGGPGSGTSPYFAQFFDPETYHIILADQRGAGLSTPKGQMKANTTQHLIEDMETIRKLFNIDKWAVFGGSWGSSLALLYAETHPERVLGLILRGIFLVRENDITAFVREDSPAALLHSRQWATFKADITRLIVDAGMPHLSVEKDKIYHICYELLQHPDQGIREKTAGTISAWEKLNSYLELDEDDLAWGHSPDGVNMGLTEATYFEHGCFIKPNQVLNDIDRLKGIPIHIVQGKYDLVCPPYMADELETALRDINAERADDLIVRYDTLAGHSHKEPANVSALIQSGNQLATRHITQSGQLERSRQSGFFNYTANDPASSSTQVDPPKNSY